jgi:hypothetical protein
LLPDDPLAKQMKFKETIILPQSHRSLIFLSKNIPHGIKFLPAILAKLNVYHCDKLSLACFFFFLLVITSNILSAFLILKGNVERTIFSSFFPKPKLVHCKEGCLKISVINKPRSYNFLDSETLHLLLKAGGGHIIFFIYYAYFKTIFYVLQEFHKCQCQIQEVNLHH